MTCLQFLISKDTLDNCLKSNVGLVKISGVVFEMISRNSQGEHFALPPPPPLSPNCVKGQTLTEALIPNLW